MQGQVNARCGRLFVISAVCGHVKRVDNAQIWMLLSCQYVFNCETVAEASCISAPWERITSANSQCVGINGADPRCSERPAESVPILPSICSCSSASCACSHPVKSDLTVQRTWSRRTLKCDKSKPSPSGDCSASSYHLWHSAFRPNFFRDNSASSRPATVHGSVTNSVALVVEKSVHFSSSAFSWTFAKIKPESDISSINTGHFKICCRDLVLYYGGSLTLSHPLFCWAGLQKFHCDIYYHG